MRRFFLAVFSVFSALFVLGILVGAFLPKDFTVSSQVAVNTSKEQLYSFVGDLEKWEEWGPWRDADPSLTVTLGQQTKGVGAWQSWVGQDGNGRLVFTEASVEKGVVFDLFFNDDAFSNVSSITYESTEDGLRVTWQMSGSVPAPIVGGYLAWMMPSMVSPLFEDGLAKLKAVAEAGN